MELGHIPFSKFSAKAGEDVSVTCYPCAYMYIHTNSTNYLSYIFTDSSYLEATSVTSVMARPIIERTPPMMESISSAELRCGPSIRLCISYSSGCKGIILHKYCT